jgi:4-hydroxybenzoate polyprenyltransferase
VRSGWDTDGPAWVEKLRQYALLVRLHRPIGILLLLWPALWALWIAGDGHPYPRVVTVFVLGVVLMRSAGCAVNDYADRNFDPHVRRTRDRPLAARRIHPEEAVAVFVVLSVTAFCLALLTNLLTVLMSVAGLFLAVTYPFTKRHTHLPQIYLGVAFGWAVPMAFAAQTGRVPAVAWAIFWAAVLWAAAYDTLYAMVDRNDDLRIGIKSAAILFGRHDRLVVGLAHAAMLTVLAVVGASLNRGWLYFTGLATAAGLAVYEQYLVRQRSPRGCLLAFVNNNWMGAAIFAGVVLDYTSRA